MTSIVLVGVVLLLGLLLVTMFSKDLRNKVLDVTEKAFSTLIKKAPVALDLVADPLKENLAKIKGA